MSLIQQIKQQLDIVQVVSEYVDLKKQGPDRYSGLCPFHPEKTPSFTVSEASQRFHCFGCDAGGDVIDFYGQIENLTPGEAIKHLAERCGIERDPSIRPIRPSFTREQLDEAQLFQVGYRRYTEELLDQAKLDEYAKEPPIPLAEFLSEGRIYNLTQSLNWISGWNEAEAAEAYLVMRRWRPELAAECVEDSQRWRRWLTAVVWALVPVERRAA